MSEMLQRVAVAIAECSMDGPWEDWSERMARAAIEAMAIPTAPMRAAAGRIWGWDTADDCYQLMMAAALPKNHHETTQNGVNKSGQSG